jgi:exodeoxyribonuclease I
MEASLFWYDIETFGRHPGLDRIAQFAGVRTDDTFEPVEEPIIEYVRIPPDYVPSLEACLLTGITPEMTLEKGIREYELAAKIYKEWTRPGTCVAGYNNIKFDDEFMRNVFYRNLFDPYIREYSRGNSRWDLINVARAAKDLRPEGINWPVNDDGIPSFKLEDVAEANGIDRGVVHEAYADVQTTIALAKLLYEKQPKLFTFLFRHRLKNRISRLINIQHREPVLHTSPFFSRQEGCTTVVAPLTVDPGNRNAIIVFDLRFDPGPLFDLSVEEIRRRVFTSRDELDEERIPLNTVHINKSPVLAPLSVLDDASAERLGIDTAAVERRWDRIRRQTNLTEKIRSVYEGSGGAKSAEAEDVELAIYSGGFFLDEDKRLFDTLHESGFTTWREAGGEFTDPRAVKLLHRLIGRNFPELFSEHEQKKWKNFCATRLLFPPDRQIDDFGTFEKKLETQSRSTELGPREKLIIRSLMDYRDRLKKTVLAYE